MTDNVCVEVQSISHQYGQRQALTDVSFDVDQGHLFALLGPNGGGKSTLFRILTTLISPTKGTARIAGADITKQSHEVRCAIGVVFQNPSLDDRLTVMENLTHQGHLYGLRGLSLRNRCHEVMAEFDIDDRAKDYVETLSGGLKRRVELAKANLHRPRVLILDEPSTGLDPAARQGLFSYLEKLKKSQGVTTLVTTHLMDEADRCDTVAFLNSGHLIALDTPKALKREIGGDVITVTGNDAPALHKRIVEKFGGKVELIDGGVRIERDQGHEFIPELIKALPDEIDSVTVGKPTLDDVFLHLTGHHLARHSQPQKKGE